MVSASSSVVSADESIADSKEAFVLSVSASELSVVASVVSSPPSEGTSAGSVTAGVWAPSSTSAFSSLFEESVEGAGASSSTFSLLASDVDSGSLSCSATVFVSAAVTVILSCPTVVATRTKTNRNAQNLCNDFAFFIPLSPLFLNNSYLKPLIFRIVFPFFISQRTVDKL